MSARSVRPSGKGPPALAPGLEVAGRAAQRLPLLSVHPLGLLLLLLLLRLKEKIK